MTSSNIAVSQKENNMDKSAILGYECESAQDEESETIGSKRLGNPLPACVELSVRLDSCAMLVIVNQDSDDHDFVEVHECESAQEEKSETIGSIQLCAPLPSMRVPPCLRPHHCHTLPLYKHCALDLTLLVYLWFVCTLAAA